MDRETAGGTQRRSACVWTETKAIAAQNNTTISDFITHLDRDKNASNPSSAPRVLVLKHHRSTLSTERRARFDRGAGLAPARVVAVRRGVTIS